MGSIISRAYAKALLKTLGAALIYAIMDVSVGILKDARKELAKKNRKSRGTKPNENKTEDA